MAIVLHFKDGTTASVPTAATIQPFPGDDNFVECLNAANALVAFVPVVNLEWAEGV